MLFVPWGGVQVHAIRTVESWRFEGRCNRLARLVETTRSAVIAPALADPDRKGDVLVIAPDIWNVTDYLCALYLFTEHSNASVAFARVLYDEQFLEQLLPGGKFDPSVQRVFTSLGDVDIERLPSAEDIPRSRWEDAAAKDRKREFGSSG